MYTLTIEDSNSETADQFSFDHGSYLIGRLEECDIVLPSSSVSRQHARIYVENDRCYIEDLGSANGVIVDGQRVVNTRDLGTASQIRIGDYYLFLEFQGADQGRKSVLNTLFISDDSEHHKLVRVNDNFAGEEFTLSEVENTIGRTDDNFILLSDPSISRRHAKIIRDGGNYTLVDLVSSNGTMLNGTRVENSKRLEEGDLVQFGDVQFVFTSGDTQIDAHNYEAESSGFQINLVAGIAILVVSCVALGGGIVYGFYWMKQSSSEQSTAEETSVDSRTNELLQRARSQAERREWQQALGTIDEVLAHDPSNQKALELRERTQREIRASELLERGENYSEEGRHADARAVLAKIPENTVAHSRAQPTLEHVEKTLAYNYKNEAIHLIKKGDGVDNLREAHEKLVRALALSPDDKEALELVREVERGLRKKNVDFEKYARQ